MKLGVRSVWFVLAGVLAAAPALADPVLSFGPSDIVASTLFGQSFNQIVVDDRGTLAFDDATAFNAFQLTPLAPFPGDLTPVPQGFVQATANGRARIAAGGGGITTTPSFSVGQARYQQRVTNIGDEPATVVMEIDIPLIQMGLLLNTPGDEGPASFVRAILDVNRFGGIKTTENIFSFVAGLNQEPGQAAVPLTLSDDLRPFALVEQFGDAQIFGARILPFKSKQTLGVLDPNTSFEIDYFVETVASDTVAERGSIALFGDPFNFDADGAGFRVFIDDAVAPAPVPEPASLTLMVAAFAAVGAALRRRGRKVTRCRAATDFKSLAD
jgi:hypothetical protein